MIVEVFLQMRFKKNQKVLAILSFLLLFVLGACGINGATSETAEPTVEESDTIVATVGDSITNYGVTGANYPDHLGELLGEEYSVLNFGEANYATQSTSDFPYETTESYEESLETNPDIVLMMLGTNDSKSENWEGRAHFKEEYSDLLEDYLELDSVSRVILASPPSAFVSIVGGGIDPAVVEEIGTVVEEIAKEYELEFVDMHEKTAGHDEWFFDGIHPNPEGAEVLANIFYEQIEN